MTISIQDADSFAEVFRSTAKLFAGKLDFGSEAAATRSVEALSQLYAALHSASISSRSVEPYLAAMIVAELQEAIAARHLQGG